MRNTSNIEITKVYEGETFYKITDLSGKLIKQSSCTWNGVDMSFDVSSLISGGVFLENDFKDTSKIVRFVKE